MCIRRTSSLEKNMKRIKNTERLENKNSHVNCLIIYIHGAWTQKKIKYKYLKEMKVNAKFMLHLVLEFRVHFLGSVA